MRPTMPGPGNGQALDSQATDWPVGALAAAVSFTGAIGGVRCFSDPPTLFPLTLRAESRKQENTSRHEDSPERGYSAPSPARLRPAPAIATRGWRNESGSRSDELRRHFGLARSAVAPVSSPAKPNRRRDSLPRRFGAAATVGTRRDMPTSRSHRDRPS